MIWQWRPNGAPCTDRHTWCYYHTYKMRECHDCGVREELWADFGIVNHGEKDESTEHRTGQQ